MKKKLNTPAQLPAEGFVRLDVLVNNPKKGTIGIFPECRSTFLNRVKTNIYPKPVKLGPRNIAWRVDEIRQLLNELGGTG